MANEKIYPKGIKVFEPRNGAPDFVLGTAVITIDQFNDWIDQNREYLTNYQGEDQLKLNILKGNGGVYFTVDTYKKP